MWNIYYINFTRFYLHHLNLSHFAPKFVHKGGKGQEWWGQLLNLVASSHFCLHYVNHSAATQRIHLECPSIPSLKLDRTAVNHSIIYSWTSWFRYSNQLVLLPVKIKLERCTKPLPHRSREVLRSELGAIQSTPSIWQGLEGTRKDFSNIRSQNQIRKN